MHIAYDMLAAMISRHYHVSVICKGDSACTRKNDQGEYEIVLPKITDETLMPVMLGYAWHEIAHVKLTDMNHLPSDRLVHSIANIFEDVRIERTIVQEYPGMLSDLRRTEAHVFGDDFSPVEESATNKLGLALQYLLSKCRGLNARAANILPLLQRCDPDLSVVLDKFAVSSQTTSSTHECIELAEQLAPLLPPLPDPKGSKGSKNSNNSEGSEGLNNSEGSNNSKDSKNEQDAMLRALSLTDRIEDESKQSSDDATKNGSYMDGLNSEMASERRMRQFVSDMPGAMAQTALAIASQLSRVLHALVQAFRLGFTTNQQRGQVNTKALYKLAVHNDRVFKRRVVQPKINTHVTLIVDGSGSMHGARADHASMAGYALLHALRQIPGVTACSWAFFDNEIVPLVSTQQPLAAAPCYVSNPCGCTPLGCAYAGISATIPSPKPGQKRLIICITDGQIDDPTTFEAALNMASKQGIVTYGIGIETAPPRAIPANNSITIDDVKELPEKMFNIAQGVLLS